MKITTTNLFVYGTLRSSSDNSAYKYISEHFMLISEAKVKGRLYDLGNYPAAIKSEDENFIMGELYALKEEGDFELAIEQLDEYEGLNTEDGEVPLYRREKVDVHHNKGISKAWVYWYNKEVTDQQLIATGDYQNGAAVKNKI